MQCNYAVLRCLRLLRERKGGRIRLRAVFFFTGNPSGSSPNFWYIYHNIYSLLGVGEAVGRGGGTHIKQANIMRTMCYKYYAGRVARRADFNWLQYNLIEGLCFLSLSSFQIRGKVKNGNLFTVARCTETTGVIAAVVSSQLAVVSVNQLTAREGSDLM